MRHTLVFTLIFFLLINKVFLAAGQDGDLPVYYYPHKTYTINDGMSQTYAYSILQDKEGFIWVGTKEGINRFDGLKFENHITNVAYPNDHIIRIIEDKTGSVWIVGFQDIYKYEAGVFTPFKQYMPDSLKTKRLQILTFDEENNFWLKVGRLQYPIYFSTKDRKCTPKKFKTKIPDDQWIANLNILSDNSNLIFSTKDDKSITLIWHKSNDKEEVIFKDKEILLYKDKMTNNVYVHLDGILYLFKNGQLIKKHKIVMPTGLFALQNKKIIISDYENNKIFKWHDGQRIDYGISPVHPAKILVDSDNIIWVASEEGLVKIVNDAIQIYTPEKGMLKSAWNIVEDDLGDYWLSSYSSGIKKLNKNSQYEAVEGYKKFLLHEKQQFYPGAMKASNGNLLFPTGENVIVYNNSKFSELEHSRMKNDRYDFIPVQDVKEIDSTYYLATEGFKVIYSNNTSKLYSDPDGLDIKRLHYIEAIEKDTQDIWWLASNFGLAAFDGNNFKNYYVNEDLKAGISCIYKDYKNNIWFGTKNGLMIHDYSDSLPLPVWEETISGSIKFITSVDTSHLVVGMLDKLLVIDLQKHYRDSLDYFLFNKENGFEGEDCIMHSDFTDSQGNIWFATRTNVMKLIPSELRLTNLPTPLRYESVTFKLPEDASYQKSRLLAKDNEVISLKSTHSFQVNFYTINHTNPNKILYQYILEGYENDWSPPSPQRYANYSNIPVGNYKLKVKTVLFNKESKVNELALKILPGKWYQAKWVLPTGILLFLSIISALFYLVYRIRNDRKKSQKTLLLKELKELKTRHKLLLNQTNPHFTFNIMNHITALVKKGELVDIRRYIGMFGELFRPMLRNDGKLMWTLKEEMEFVDSYLQLEKLRFPDKFEYIITVSDDVQFSTFVPKMITQSFVNNAIKHGIEPKKSKDGKIEVTISQRRDFLYIFIEDNGIGFPGEIPNPVHSKGSGIRTLRNTLEWLNEHYPVQSSIHIENLNIPANGNTGAKIILELFAGYDDL